ncbi:hypothetical protein FHP25_04745 [Vineibacter terrae]|uniref:Uncharacterized protein n=1 Tax=Vineibacter terrae TaxID=2586908 RepID=A0A5C8PST4_9HYPH|nr:hypothetical protein [Vineibacter terrae]TXL80344.1 hypothetical protein FHP25_04745 [Vineibacter terrae]
MVDHRDTDAMRQLVEAVRRLIPPRTPYKPAGGRAPDTPPPGEQDARQGDDPGAPSAPPRRDA